MTATTTGARPAASDLVAAGEPAVRRPFLHRLNPIAKLAAPLPVMIALLFTRDVLTPLLFTVGALALLLLGARLSGRAIAALLIGTPAGVALIGFTLGVWVDRARIDPAAVGADVVLVEVGDWRFTLAAYLVGVATALRIAAILLLSLVVGLTTTGPELVRALVQNLRVPYRVGFTALAALRFVPRFRRELDLIRAAHRVRGLHRGRGPVAALRRMVSYAIPLLASSVRHAERVALAMDARAFGAHPIRTERVISRWRARDTVFVVLFWAASVAVFWWGLAVASR
ncbi:energy-coupling factor transporter transmembrane protein EcfT [Agromyces sp. Marseille-P2726]|uniref:energy-coupling factor transporter transmembrane component T family protein n=1 Tax=Agromyces sp. Marseille-P2726 TaxID=2709132 RepID=UPI00156F1287|nr:energy-coupling factor transporter transmembrane component T [Agromyces sp. Marseille-P2726]